MRQQHFLSFLNVILIAVAFVASNGQSVMATPVTLINATATQEQFPITNTYVADGNGWATLSMPAVAVYQAATPIAWVNNQYTFDLISNSQYGDHVLGKFRLSYTSDVGPLSPGSNWTQFTPTLATALLSNPVTIDGNNVIQATDVGASFDTITVTADLLSYSPITGFRLEVIQDGTGPYQGPGIPGNSNFVLDAFLINLEQLPPPPAPEPATCTLLALGLVGVAMKRRRQRRLVARSESVREHQHCAR